MSDPGFREIHLSGKHVVFLFMAGAVAAVAIFLLGVSVGKGITKTEATSAQVMASAGAPTEPASSAAQDSTKPNPGELQAFNSLQGKDAPKPSATPAVATPAATPAESPSPTPQTKSSPVPTPAPAKTAEKSDPPAASGSYYVLVDSFASRTNANKELADLKKKGHSNATVYTVTGSKAPYKVRVGPLPDYDAATALKARLEKEGYKPSITR